MKVTRGQKLTVITVDNMKDYISSAVISQTPANPEDILLGSEFTCLNYDPATGATNPAPVEVSDNQYLTFLGELSLELDQNDIIVDNNGVVYFRYL